MSVTRESLLSNEKFAELLRAYGVEPPMKHSPSNPDKLIYAFAKTDDGFKELLNHPIPAVKALASARLGIKSTLNETRTKSLLEIAGRGPIPVELRYYGAHTGRWSGSGGINLQNLPRGGELRKCLLAPEGYVLVVIDLAQIECRMVNWLAGQEDVLQAFRENRDLYSEGASRFYGRPISRDDKLERFLGKTLELGCGYGMGAKKFQLTCKQGALGGTSLALSDDESKRAVNSYRRSHPRVVNLWKKGDDLLLSLLTNNKPIHLWPFEIRGTSLILPNGGKLDYSILRRGTEGFYLEMHEGKSKIYGGKIIENIVQALSRVVLSQAMLKISEKYKIVTCTHDEVVYLAKEDEAKQAYKWGLEIMKTEPAWCKGIPLDAEGGYAREYSK